MAHKKYKILSTGTGAWQVYKLLSVNEDGTTTYSRQPDYKTSGTIMWFKSKQAAKDWIKEQENINATNQPR